MKEKNNFASNVHIFSFFNISNVKFFFLMFKFIFQMLLQNPISSKMPSAAQGEIQSSLVIRRLDIRILENKDDL